MGHDNTPRRPPPARPDAPADDDPSRPVERPVWVERPPAHLQQPGSLADPQAGPPANQHVNQHANQPGAGVAPGDPPPPPRHPAPPSHTATSRATKTSRRRWPIRTLLLVAVMAGIGLSATATLQIRLARAPIMLDRFVPALERGLNRELTGMQVRIGSALMQRGETTGKIEFRLRDLRLVDHSGATVARAPEAAFQLSRNALLRGNIAPKTIVLIRPRLVFSYVEGSGIALSFAGFQATGGAKAPALADEAGGATLTGPGARRSIGLVEVLRDAFAAARERRAATSFLKSVGVRDAVLIFRQKTTQSVWTAPKLQLHLRHRAARSMIRGEGRLAHGGKPWDFAFEIDDTPARGAFLVRTIFKDLVPGEFSQTVPALADLKVLGMPLSGHSEFELTERGEIAAASADIVLGAGRIGPGALAGALAGPGASPATGETADAPSGASAKAGRDSIILDEGHIKLSYTAEKGRLEVQKLDLSFAAGRVVLAGHLTPPDPRAGLPRWGYAFAGKLRFAETVGSANAPLNDVTLSGTADPSAGELGIDRMQFTWPNGTLTGQGRLSTASGIALNGQIGQTTAAGLFEAWPPAVATDARTWLQQNMSAKAIDGGQFSLSLPADFMSRMRAGDDIPSEALSLDVAARGLKIAYAPGLSPILLKTATASLRGRSFRLRAPKGWVKMRGGERLDIAHGDFTIPDLRQEIPDAQLFMKASGSARAVTAFLQQKGLGYLKPGDVPKRLSGKASGTLRLKFPLADEMKSGDFKILGQIQLNDGRADDVFGNVDAAGGSVVFDLTEKAIEAHGDLLLNGVAAKVRWLHLIGAARDRQPPLRISATLDDTDRDQLGLAINHIVSGPVPTEVTIVARTGNSSGVHVQADLTAASIGLDYLSWKKLAGQSSLLQFDVAPAAGGRTELQNLKVIGEGIAIDGWVSIGKDNRVRKFAFPEFSFNVISRMEVKGELQANNVWDVRARGRSFDGRNFFRGLFSPRRLTEHVPAPAHRRAGIDITAEFKTVIGFDDTALHDMIVHIKRRNGKLAAFDLNGKLDSGKPVTALLKYRPGQPRVIEARTEDAGQVFRLVGFYNNIRKGEAALRVDLDARGSADIQGVLWTRRFLMLGDTVVEQVLENSRDSGAQRNTPGLSRENSRSGGSRRTVIEFDQMRLNFRVGSGQFVLRKSYINGPALGATLRGKVDFGRARVDLAGTYVPLYGVNAALGGLPIFGQLLVGRRGEGIFGITFQIRGALARPEVLVNPISLLTPGVTRKIFETESPSRTITTPKRARTRRSGKPIRPHGSAAPVIRGESEPDGWSVQRRDQ